MKCSKDFITGTGSGKDLEASKIVLDYPYDYKAIDPNAVLGDIEIIDTGNQERETRIYLYINPGYIYIGDREIYCFGNKLTEFQYINNSKLVLNEMPDGSIPYLVDLNKETPLKDYSYSPIIVKMIPGGVIKGNIAMNTVISSERGVDNVLGYYKEADRVVAKEEGDTWDMAFDPLDRYAESYQYWRDNYVLPPDSYTYDPEFNEITILPDNIDPSNFGDIFVEKYFIRNNGLSLIQLHDRPLFILEDDQIIEISNIVYDTPFVIDSNLGGEFDDDVFLRIVYGNKLITDPTGLNLSVITKDLSANVFPEKDIVYIDPQTSKLLFPGPIYSSDFDSVDSIENPRISFVNSNLTYTPNCTGDDVRFEGAKVDGKQMMHLYAFNTNQQYVDEGVSLNIFDSINMSSGTIAFMTRGRSSVNNTLSATSEIHINLGNIEIILRYYDMVYLSFDIIHDGKSITSGFEANKINVGNMNNVIYILWGSLINGHNLRLHINDENTGTDTCIYGATLGINVDNLSFDYRINSDANIVTDLYVDELNVWAYDESSDFNWFYNEGNGIEKPISSIYGPQNNYILNIDGYDNYISMFKTISLNDYYFSIEYEGSNEPFNVGIDFSPLSTNPDSGIICLEIDSDKSREEETISKIETSISNINEDNELTIVLTVYSKYGNVIPNEDFRLYINKLNLVTNMDSEYYTDGYVLNDEFDSVNVPVGSITQSNILIANTFRQSDGHILFPHTISFVDNENEYYVDLQTDDFGVCYLKIKVNNIDDISNTNLVFENGDYRQEIDIDIYDVNNNIKIYDENLHFYIGDTFQVGEKLRIELPTDIANPNLIKAYTLVNYNSYLLYGEPLVELNKVDIVFDGMLYLEVDWVESSKVVIEYLEKENYTKINGTTNYGI